MLTFYRLYLGSGRTAVSYASKEVCFRSYVEAFGLHGLSVFIDGDEKPGWLPERVPVNFLHGLGNSGSCWYVLQQALCLGDDTTVYLAEDDYLYRPACGHILLEGFQTGADYVTLYDHPDKYVGRSKKDNPLAATETSRLFVTDSSHWRTSNSTTMTFAAKVGTLRQDADVMRRHLQKAKPKDFRMFQTLAKAGRMLVSAIPGIATHCVPGFMSPLTDWNYVCQRFQ